MAEQPFFSVIIPVYNRLELFEHALQSVINQNYTDYEIVVIDDGSDPDQSPLGLIEKLTVPIQCIRLEASIGPSGARNHGIRNARGRYIAFLDSDDQWSPHALSKFHRGIQQYSFPAICRGGVLQVDLDQVVPLASVGPENEGFNHVSCYFALPESKCWIAIGAVAISTCCLRNHGGFIESINCAEDTDLWLRMGCEAGFAYTDANVLIYRRHTQSQTLGMNSFSCQYQGLQEIIRSERLGLYPGGGQLATIRREIITGHTRSFSLNSGSLTQWRYCLTIYCKTFIWNLQLNKIKYLFGFWLNPLLNQENRWP